MRQEESSKGEYSWNESLTGRGGIDRHQARRYARNRGLCREPLTYMPSALILTWAMPSKSGVTVHPRQAPSSATKERRHGPA
jgi:hypothetical protein